jgi:uncharacterized membrane protein
MIEETITRVVLGLKLFVETVGALFIALGAVLAILRFLKSLAHPTIRSYESIRLLLGRFLSLGLEFQLAADILGSAVAPSWTQIGKLAAIAVIRTFLNYFLAREMKEEQEAVGTEPA